jgi:hypothetical protein
MKGHPEEVPHLRRRVVGAALGPPTPLVASSLWASPPADFCTSSLFWVKNGLRGFSGLFTNIFRTTFLKHKNSRKQELALGILSIG